MSWRDLTRAPGDAIGVAVVGAGYWGPNLVRNFTTHPRFDLRWVCDTDAGRAKAVGCGIPGVRITDDLDDVLADPGTAAVAVCTPVGTHAALGAQVLAAGRHLLMEKPLAASLAEGEALVDAAERADLTLMCDHTFCFTPAVRELKAMIADGRLGDLYYIDSTRVNLGLVQSDVDVIWDLAAHDVSILDHVLPEGVHPVGVSATGADPIRVGRACVGYLSVALSTGAVAHVSVSWLSPTKVRQMIVAGSKSMVIWDDMKPYQRLTVVDCGVDVDREAPADAKRDLMVSYRVGDMVIPALKETGEALAGVVTEFASAITTGRPARTDGRSGLRVLAVLDAAERSMAAGGLRVPLAGGVW